jgi:hypothetical protein
MRLDEEKLEALRGWGEGLQRAESEELSATGRAILMLVEEITHLHVELWHARLQETVSTDDSTGTEEESVGSSLRGRLQRAVRGQRSPAASGSSEQGSDTETDRSAQSWIESLRPQK